jgi:threonylcarbamoyladenosine tRNA methylthiotransferase MtaB
MKTISLHTLGCKVNHAETSQLREKFEGLGYTIAEFGQPSDIVLINTCSVTNNADVEARKVFRRTKRQNPNAFLGVLGCYAQLKPDEVAAIDEVDAVFGQREKFRIPSLLHDMLGGEKTQSSVSCIDDLPFDEATTYDNESRTRAFIKLQDGCNYHCSFCTIPLARGASRSMPFDRVKAQFEKVAEGGYREAVISGINLGDYSTPDGKTFTDVVRLIDSLDLDLRVRISSIEPNLLNDEIIDIVANSNIFVPHFHIPLQSGSQELLRKMKRRYKATYYRDLIHRIKDKMPDSGIGVDVIVGFPGESDGHFLTTFDFLDALPVSYLHAFTYSERDNTAAAKMPGVVPVEKRKKRTNLLRKLSDRKKLAFYKSQTGTIRTVLPETFNQAEGSWLAWTENYVRVKFPGSESIKNEWTKLEITGIEGDKAMGKIV